MINPVVDGWYADPESRVYGDTVYMYVTNSLPFEQQLNIDLVTTKDLEHFETYRSILDMTTFKGADFAIWAPSVVDKDGKYYIVFAANDIHPEDERCGLYIGVSDDPHGPFKNVFADGRPLLNKFYNKDKSKEMSILEKFGAILKAEYLEDISNVLRSMRKMSKNEKGK